MQVAIIHSDSIGKAFTFDFFIIAEKYYFPQVVFFFFLPEMRSIYQISMAKV